MPIIDISKLTKEMPVERNASFYERVFNRLTSRNPHSDRIYFKESEDKLDLKFVTQFDTAFIFSCNKLGTYDACGKTSCNINICNACRRTSERIYSSPIHLESMFVFLNFPPDDKKLLETRGIFDIFYATKKFILSFYLNGILLQAEFPTQGIFDPGCYPEFSKSFYDLNIHRQVLFQCLVFTTENIKIADPDK